MRAFFQAEPGIMQTQFESLYLLAPFSLDDPEAGRKLIENLDRRQVRVQVGEMCWHFGIAFPTEEDRVNVRAFLCRLVEKGDLVEAAGGLFCRPELREGKATVEEALNTLAALSRRLKIGRSPEPKAERLRESHKDYRKRLKAQRAEVLKSIPPPALEKDVLARAMPKSVFIRKRRPLPEEVTPLAENPSVAPATTFVELKPAGPPASTTTKPWTIQKQKEWVLKWLRAQGGSATKTATADMAMAAGVINALSEIEAIHQQLFDNNRVYLHQRLLKLTHFGNQEAEYLELRREALEAPILVLLNS